MTKRFDSLQAGRGMAALLVVLFHSQIAMVAAHPQSRLSWVFDGGRSGVDFFFVLSGFLMMFLHKQDFGRVDRIGAYVSKRVTRIYPPYWVLCAVLIPASIAAPALMKTGKVTASLLASWLLLLPHAGVRLMGGVTWTLEYEVAFYTLFLPFFVSRRLGMVLFAVWGAAILGAAVFLPPAVDATGIYTGLPFAGGFLLNLHCIEFLCGILVAMAISRGFAMRRPGWWLAGSVAAWLTFMIYDAKTALVAHHLRRGIAVYAVLATATLLGAVLLERQGGIQVPRWLRELGAASYSIYLTHYLVMMVAHLVFVKVAAFQRIPAGAILMVLVPVALVPGFVLHYVVERPLMIWLGRRRVRIGVEAGESVPELLEDRHAA